MWGCSWSWCWVPCCGVWLQFSRQHLFQSFFFLCFFHIRICIWKNCLLVHYRIEENLTGGLTTSGRVWVWVVFFFYFYYGTKKNIHGLVKHLLAQKTLYRFQPLLEHLWSGTGTIPINTSLWEMHCIYFSPALFHLNALLSVLCF